MKDKKPKEGEAKCGHPLYWYGMYKSSYDLIAPDSFAHPAKMSPTLCYKILQHLQELGLLKKGDTILDPMAGTGMTNICAGAMGYPSISVELEEKFVGFQQENKGYAERRLYKPLDWQILRGDSRKLSRILQGEGLKSVMSPPYEQTTGSDNPDKRGGLFRDPKRRNDKTLTGTYGESEGQIGNLKDTPLKSITSPPYGIDKTSGGLNTKPPRSGKDQSGRNPNSPSQAGAKEGFGKTEGQIGKLKDKPLKSITSPPYANRVDDHGVDQKGYEGFTDKLGEYGQSEGQIGRLKDNPLKAITSPPYGETGVGDWKTGRAEFQEWVINELKTKGYVEWQGKRYNEAEWRVLNHGRIDGRTTKGVHKHPTDGYSENPDNLGNLKDTPLKAITSPPYGESITGGKSGIDWQEDWGEPSERRQPSQDISYGQEKDNIGNLPNKPLKSVRRGLDGTCEIKGESYLEAMTKVYTEIAKVSDVLVVVVKNPTRNGKLRRLDLDTIKIIEMAGWTIHCQHRALLFEELEQADLFGEAKNRSRGGCLSLRDYRGRKDSQWRIGKT